MNVRFVACSETSCPMNCDKQCRAPFLMVDENGYCMIRDGGPYDNKAATESYVDIRECRCKSCNHWEKDESGVVPVGVCGLGSDLFFSLRSKDGNPASICSDFDKQVDQPGFAATL